jgi:hypothetical protein
LLTNNDKELWVSVRIPSIDFTQEPGKSHLDALLTLIHYGFGVAVDHIRVIRDPDMGPTLSFEPGLLKVLDELSSSVAVPVSQSGNISQLGEYKGTLPGILASIHLLALKQSYVRRRTPLKGRKVTHVTLEMLKATFNARSGLGKSNTVSAALMRAVLAEMTSSRNKRFPGAWIAQNRHLNTVKTDLALLFKMGYTEKVAHPHRLQQVLFNTVTLDPSGKRKVRSILKEEDEKHLSYPVFRAGTVMLARKLDTSSGDSFESQARVDPLQSKSRRVIDNFNDQKVFRAVDALNRASAILDGTSRGTSKCEPVHFEQARNEFINQCAHLPIIDSKGITYESIQDLPRPVTDYCRKVYRYSTEPKDKRSRPESLPQDSQDLKRVKTIPRGKSPQNKKRIAETLSKTAKAKVVEKTTKMDVDEDPATSEAEKSRRRW